MIATQPAHRDAAPEREPDAATCRLCGEMHPAFRPGARPVTPANAGGEGGERGPLPSPAPASPPPTPSQLELAIAAVDARDLALAAIQCSLSARHLFKESIGDRSGLREEGCLALWRSATALAIETCESALIACSKVPGRMARLDEIARFLGHHPSPSLDHPRNPSVRSDAAPCSS